MFFVNAPPLSRVCILEKYPSALNRGREGRLIPASPAAKPDEQISRIRLSSQWAVFTD